MNVTFHLKDPHSPNNATLYFDSLSFKPDAVVVLQSEGKPIGTIVGAVIGGMAILVALGICIYLYVRRRREKKQKELEREMEKDREAMASGSNDPLVDPYPANINNNNGVGGGQDGNGGVPIVRSPIVSQQQRPYSANPSVHTPHPPSVHSPQFERRSLHQSHHAPSIMSGNSGNNANNTAGADLDRQNTMLPAYPTSNQDAQSMHSTMPPPLPSSPVYSNRPTSPITDLESFARANPYLIDNVLLEKLRKARYSPLTSPTVLTEHEWYQQFNVNKLEYERITEAYNMATSQAVPTGYDAL
ncbi:hypothetical protein CPB86DRAFT_415824 [Serendipita vermifera]|nr:hypothetical protein CPB86DRAFT_415824 [Serendipita vermifera]